MDGTVRENIVMGLDFKKKWYDEVVNASGLALDFTQFPYGDATIVGDRGVQCSGGQRARIGLARALYRDADVLVCDDPLSAVDAKVGRLLFHEAIEQLAVNRGKCVVLATHQHQYVGDSRCVLMVGGRVKLVGTYEECVEASEGQLKAHEGDDTVDNLADELVEEPAKVGKPGILKKPFGKADDDTKELNVTGLVSLNTYIQYAKAMGGVWVGVFLLVLFCVTQASAFLSIFFVGRWSRRPADEQVCRAIIPNSLWPKRNCLISLCFLDHSERMEYTWFDYRLRRVGHSFVDCKSHDLFLLDGDSIAASPRSHDGGGASSEDSVFRYQSARTNPQSFFG
jgi:ATP-binding cassette subfamily C (CFTR/MRP) protein 4